jgi:hypothetical protein
MSRKTRELEARVAELERKLDNINRNMEYISKRIYTAAQIELDEAWQISMEKLKKQLGGEE